MIPHNIKTFIKSMKLTYQNGNFLKGLNNYKKIRIYEDSFGSVKSIRKISNSVITTKKKTSKERITICCTSNMDGTDRHKLIVVGKSKMP
ncbi:hypothetical protein A3Q56_08303, partial [Intoshia linei]